MSSVSRRGTTCWGGNGACVIVQLGHWIQVVNGGELRTNIKGQSELTVKGVFVAAKALAPCVLFLDECDHFAPAREGMASGIAMGGSQGASGAGLRVLGTLMQEMDALQDLKGDAAYAPPSAHAPQQCMPPPATTALKAAVLCCAFDSQCVLCSAGAARCGSLEQCL